MKNLSASGTAQASQPKMNRSSYAISDFFKIATNSC